MAKQKIHKKEQIQPLIGKLSFIMNCVHAGRVFLLRMINAITGISETNITIPIRVSKRCGMVVRISSQF